VHAAALTDRGSFPTPTSPRARFPVARLGADRVPDPRGLQAGSEPGPGNVSPCAAIEVRCADRDGGGQGEHSMGVGNGSPHANSGLAVSVPEQPVCLGGNFLSAPEMLWTGHKGAPLVLLSLLA